MTSSKRFLLVGSLVSLAGGTGLVRFGAQPVRVFDCLNWVVPVRSASLGPDLAWTTVSFLLFTVGVCVTTLGLQVAGRRRAISKAGRTLVAMAGLGMVLGGVLDVMGIQTTQTTFHNAVTGGDFPNTEMIEKSLGHAEATVTGGHVLLLGSSTLLVLATVLCSRQETKPVAPRVLDKVVGIVGLLACVAASAACLWVTIHGFQLDRMFLDPEPMVPRPSALARQLTSLWNTAQVAGIFLAIQGIALAMGVFPNRRTSRPG